MLSLVVMRVARMRTSRTSPVTPDSSSTQSPTSSCRSKRMTMPATKFATMLCRPKPIPTPSAPRISARLVKSTPTVARPIGRPSVKTA